MQDQPTKRERKQWGAEAAMAKAQREARTEDRKREWTRQAAVEDRCALCGWQPAQRCRDNDSCSEAVMENLERRRRQEPGRSA